MTINERGNTRGSPIISNIHFGNNNQYIGLVDSGSDVSLIDWSVVENIPSKNIFKIRKSRPTQLNSASGHGIKSLGKATISMQIMGRIYKVNFILTKGFKFEVFLGSDFIYEHNATIDFQKNVMIIKNKVIILRCKSELPRCNLLEASRSQIIEPYTMTIPYLITGLFAELPGQSCHGFNGRA